MGHDSGLYDAEEAAAATNAKATAEVKGGGPQPWSEQVLIDCDGVLAEMAIPPDKAYWGSPELIPLQEPGYATNVATAEGSHALVKSIRGIGLDITILTSPWDDSPTWDWDRRIWLKREFEISKYDVIFSKRKWAVGGLTLIEDNAGHARAWAEQWGRPSILINQRWNADQYTDRSVIRVDSLMEAAVAVRSLHAGYNRSSQ